MWTGAQKMGWIGRAAMAAAGVILCAPGLWAFGQHSSAHAPRGVVAQRRSAPGYRPDRPRNQRQPAARSQDWPRANVLQRPGSGYPATAPRGGNPNTGYPGTPYAGPGFSRPDHPGYAQSFQAPPGHLGDWLNRHRNLSVQEQERTLRGDPSFRRLAPGEQQRLMDRLHQVNQMPEQQRDRWLARNELIEHLSPQERMQVNLSARRLASMPPDRKTLMRSAFRDLRGVPPDQRSIILNSARYQGVFSPDERGVLSDMLRVEPYQPPGQ